MASSLQKLGENTGAGAPSQPQNQPCRHRDLGLLPPDCDKGVSAVRGPLSAVLGTQPQDTDTVSRAHYDSHCLCLETKYTSNHKAHDLVPPAGQQPRGSPDQGPDLAAHTPGLCLGPQ